MAKIIEQKASSQKEFINREDYEWTQKNNFVNATILVATVSIYATFAYITIKYLGSKNKTE